MIQSSGSETVSRTALKCVVCGKKASLENTLNLPSCVDHQELPTKAPVCPECDKTMMIKKGAERAFWSCPDYPTCFGTRNLLKPLEDPDLL